MGRGLRTAPHWQTLTVVGASCAGVLVWANLWRPLWLDEVYQFSLAGMPWDVAVNTLRETTGAGVNFSQTGFFYVLNWLLPRLFGVSAFAVRAPSLLSAGLLLVSAAVMLRSVGLRFRWQVGVIVALVASSSLMTFTGEARHYMPFAACTVMTFTFYVRRSLGITGWITRLLGGGGLLVGALFHPYWLFMTAVAIVFGWSWEPRATPRRDIRTYLALPLLIPGVVVYAILAFMTWAKSSPPRGNEPLEFIGSPVNLLDYFLRVHMSLSQDSLVLSLCLSCLLLTVVGIALRKGVGIRGPVLLIACGLGSSTVFILVSVLREHWVVQRQWTAGIALVTIGITWLFASLDAAKIDTGGSRYAWWSFIAIAGASVAVAVVTQIQASTTGVDYWRSVAGDGRTPSEIARAASSYQDWVYLANVNVFRGGAPWPELAGFYEFERTR